MEQTDTPPPDGAPLLRARNLVKRYQGRTVVDHISFTVQRGECFGLLGPNGAGKTTTLRMIVGLTPADGGELTLFGLPMHPEQRAARQRMGVVSQEDNLDTDLGVAENLRIYGRYFGLPGALIEERLERLLRFAQLSDRAGQAVGTLSGGMRRRLVLARSLVADPELVVLDEPTTGLDPQARHLIWQRLRTLRDDGVTLLLTTHYMDEAARLCDRLLVMDHGAILDLGTPRELIARHVEPEVVEITGQGDPPDPATLGNPDGRQERMGDTLYCYTRDAAPLMERLSRRPDLAVLMRPANLEDVFLKLTGRELRD
ncbi:MAG: ATP-binding cassette domain-containing protein [Magnetococcales bacterium]|nr:ATP-binding cassette domain-containing protein [Magnetococcales bacterium]